MQKLLLIVSFIILCFQGGRAQSLLHSKPLDYNSGFAGNKTYDRISLNVGKLTTDARNIYFSYDKLVKPAKGGIGTYISRKNNQLTDLNANNISEDNELNELGIVYSPKYIVKSKVLISPSASMSYANYNRQLRQKIDETNSILLSENTQKSYVGNSIGVLLNSKIAYIGYQFKSQLGEVTYTKHQAQLGLTHKLDSKTNLIIDTRFSHGTLLDDKWRSYQHQINVAYQYGVLTMGTGFNDFSSISVMAGLKLINLKINAAYHVLSPSDFAKVELGVQYVFNKNNQEKLELPFEKWLIKLKR